MPKLVTKKLIKENDLSEGQYCKNKNKKFKTPTLRSDFCDYREAYAVVKKKCKLDDANENDIAEKVAGIEDNAPFM